jgi:hypothetical protein
MMDEAGDFRRYLLGELSGIQRDTLEKALMTGEEAFRDLLIAEDELIDDYCAGALSESERRAFESHFLVTDDRRRQVRFAAALRNYASAGARSAGLLTGRWHRFREIELAWRFAAAAAVALAAVGLWMVVSLPTERPEGKVVALFLTAELRSYGELPSVILPRGTETLELQLDLKADEHENYEVVVARADGREIFSEGGLLPRTIEARRVLVASIPASLLAPGEYRVILRGSGARIEDIGRYDIRVQND